MESALGVKPSVVNVAAICGSLRKASFKHSLIRSAIDLSKQSVEGMLIQYVDLSPLPMLNTNIKIDYKYPPPVKTDRNFFLFCLLLPTTSLSSSFVSNLDRDREHRRRNIHR
ncbi:hypothetical protein L6452_10512 [Arctium lappa]|uniref:Uncharacterized protein n=1 Tax=Arctium lappa TaxID=4217 RepID=A0ACB9DN06_ARCLA|nr:hypothetical protein L6452_10512 [Arctium lappa]